jgi:uncharacterized protein (TIGR03086 family)
MDLLKNFDEASQWVSERVPGAVPHLDEPSANEGWTVRALVNHLCDTQQYFISKARGEDATFPDPSPPELVGDDPSKAYAGYRAATLDAYSDPQVQEKQGFGLGASFVEQLVHGWDLAKSTGQDATMPPHLAEAALQFLDGNLTDENRGTLFKPAVAIAPNAPPQDKLLAYTGRRP